MAGSINSNILSAFSDCIALSWEQLGQLHYSPNDSSVLPSKSKFVLKSTLLPVKSFHSILSIIYPPFSPILAWRNRRIIVGLRGRNYKRWVTSLGYIMNLSRLKNMIWSMNRKKALLLFILWMLKLSTVIAIFRNLNTIVFHLLKQIASAYAKNGCGRFSPVST